MERRTDWTCRTALLVAVLLWAVDVQKETCPLLASACCLQLRDDRFMRLALGEARRALALGEVPVGCVIVRAERVVSKGHKLQPLVNVAPRMSWPLMLHVSLAVCNSNRKNCWDLKYVLFQT